MKAMRVLAYLNLALLLVYPVAWFAPLMRAGIELPLARSIFAGQARRNNLFRAGRQGSEVYP